MNNKGSSLVEVIVMMVIMSMAIVGVYTMINNGQKLATLTDNRLIASNLAREGLEAIGALRDTYELRATETTGCFFTTDLSANPGKCYQGKLSARYTLADDLTLIPGNTALPVCINASGWYSQEWAKGGPLVTGSILCKDADRCLRSDEISCRTPFTRSIIFEPCGGVPFNQCVDATVEIIWGKNADESFHLEQMFTKH